MNAPARLRILLVDDNEDAAETMAMLLDAQGHDVKFAFDGATALRLAAEHKPQVVLLDITLPDMDGYEVARRLRATPDGRMAVIMAVTGYGSNDDVRRSVEAGIDRHLTKPIDPMTLDKLIRESLTK
ncbi:MAG: response regulator [Usitatibacter sp.]